MVSCFVKWWEPHSSWMNILGLHWIISIMSSTIEFWIVGVRLIFVHKRRGIIFLKWIWKTRKRLKTLKELFCFCHSQTRSHLLLCFLLPSPLIQYFFFDDLYWFSSKLVWFACDHQNSLLIQERRCINETWIRIIFNSGNQRLKIDIM